MTSSDAVDAAEQLLAALEGLRDATRRAEVAVRRGLDEAGRGGDVWAAFTAVDPAAVRESMNQALKAVEQTRHRMRLAVFASALERGTSIGELGRLFGFSRQLAARYAKEAEGAPVASR